MRRLIVLAAVAVVALAGCGGEEATPTVRAFTVSYPHGVLVARERVQVAGDVTAVYLGTVRLDADDVVCVSANGTGAFEASYAIADGVVTVTLDARRECSPADPVPIVGGFAEDGGYVGEWSPGAVLYVG